MYLPRSWTTDPARCAAAGIPPGTVFATKPKLARRMIARALDAGCPAAWVTGDEVYGADPGLRADLERRLAGYVLAVAASHQVTTGAGSCQVRTIAGRLPRRAWQRYSAGAGAKGHRYYDWAWAAIDPGPPGHRWLLIRRNRHTGELALARRRCHRRTVPRVISRCACSVLGSCRISAASAARSAQSSRGRGLRRRRTATSCRSTSSSACLDAGDRPSKTSQPHSRMRIR